MDWLDVYLKTVVIMVTHFSVSFATSLPYSNRMHNSCGRYSYDCMHKMHTLHTAYYRSREVKYGKRLENGKEMTYDVKNVS